MQKGLIIIFVIMPLTFAACKQNGDASKQMAREYENVSKEVDMLEGKKSTASDNNFKDNQLAPIYKIKVIKVLPHASDAYTQGLIYHNGFLYESTGLNGKSSLRKVEIETGKVIKEYGLNPDFFAEGIEIYQDKIYQLTWESEICFVYNLETFEMINELSYHGEGWGLTKNNGELIMSNGSSILKFVRPEDFQVQKTLAIRDGGLSLDNINELEFINGEIWANIYQQKKIARINPETGKVNSWLDLSPLYDYVTYGEKHDVLNGIAFDKDKNRIFVTGKLWKSLFEIKVLE